MYQTKKIALIVRIFFDSREDVFRVLTKERVRAESGKAVHTAVNSKLMIQNLEIEISSINTRMSQCQLDP